MGSPGKTRTVDDVRAPVEDRPKQARIIGRVVFKVGILYQDDFAGRMLESRAQRRALAAVVGMREHTNAGIALDFFEKIARAVGGGVVDENNLLLQAAGISRTHAADEFLYGTDFVENRNQDGEALEAFGHMDLEYRDGGCPRQQFFSSSAARRLVLLSACGLRAG